MKIMFWNGKTTYVVAFSLLLMLCVASTRGGLVYAQTSNKGQSPAQSPEESAWIQITVVHVKPTMVPEFMKLARETMEAHRKAGVEWRDFWVSDTFGDYSEYTIVTPFKKFAQYDKGSMLEQGFGAAGFEAWRAKIRNVVEDVRGYAVRMRPDLSIGKMTQAPKLAVKFTTRVAPGREQEYEAYLKTDYLPVFKRSGVAPLFIGQIVFGGDSGEYVGVAFVDNFADLDKGPPINRVLNETDAEKLMMKLKPGIVLSQSRSIIRYLPELSYMPANSETTSKRN